jgi:hypothetical protein
VTKSRGIRERHGQKGTLTYKRWKAMHTRCGNPRQRCYPYYGGRGIKVCARWRSFTAFLADMGECPEGLTLDRKDSDGNYEPGNCRWATRAVQNANRRYVAVKTSGLPVGVRQSGQRFNARYKEKSLGCFSSVAEAQAAYQVARQRHFGEFA